MTVREFKELIASISTEDDDLPVIVYKESGFPGVFGFEGVCPAVTEVVTLGPSPDYLSDGRNENKHQEMRAFLIAGHSFHQGTDMDGHAAQNDNQQLN